MARLIDADALIEKIKDYPYGYRGMIEADIAQIPTIDPVKHGRWRREHLPSTNGGTYEVWRCSECQSAFNWRMRYCGHCGARMDEVTE